MKSFLTFESVNVNLYICKILTMRITLLLLILILISFLGCKKDNSQSNQPPSALFINPAPPLAIISIEDTLNIIALVNDADGEVKSVQFYLDGILLADDSKYPWSQEVSFEEEGEYTIAITALDNNQRISDTVKTFVRVKDYNKADIDISIFPKYHKKEGDSVTIRVSSFSNNGKILNSKVFLNELLIAYDTVSYLDIALDSVKVGAYSVYVIVEDESGKISKNYKVFYVDENKPPQIELSYLNTNSLIPGSTLYVDAYATDQDGEIDFVNFFLNDSLVHTSYDSDFPSFSLYLPKSGEYKLSATVYDDNGALAVAEDKFFVVRGGFLPNGPITNIIPSTKDNMFFALSKSESQLMLLYPSTTTFERINLPYSIPVDMDYSISEEKLFIVFAYSGVVSIWDQNSKEFNTIEFSSTADATSVKADVIHRRIYIETSEGLFILDMDSGDVLLTDTSLEYNNFIIDTKNQLMVTSDDRYNNVVLKKYSLVNDSFELVQTRGNLGYRDLGMVLNKQKDYYMVITTTGNDGDGTNYAFKSSNINELYGQFDNIEYSRYTSFSNDGNALITVGDYENKLYLLNAESLQIEQSLDLVQGANAIIAINNSKTMVVVFSHSIYDTDYKVLYYKLD